MSPIKSLGPSGRIAALFQRAQITPLLALVALLCIGWGWRPPTAQAVLSWRWVAMAAGVVSAGAPKSKLEMSSFSFR